MKINGSFQKLRGAMAPPWQPLTLSMYVGIYPLHVLASLNMHGYKSYWKKNRKRSDYISRKFMPRI